MIIREYFHGFQYKHQTYIDFNENNIVQVQPDSLKSIYKNHDWFKKSIDKENSLLLKAISETDKVKIIDIIDALFYEMKGERILNKN